MRTDSPYNDYIYPYANFFFIIEIKNKQIANSYFKVDINIYNLKAYLKHISKAEKSQKKLRTDSL